MTVLRTEQGGALCDSCCNYILLRLTSEVKTLREIALGCKIFFLRLAERAVKHCRSSRTRGGMNKTPPSTCKTQGNTTQAKQKTQTKNQTKNHKATTTTTGKCEGEGETSVKSETSEALSGVELPEEAWHHLDVAQTSHSTIPASVGSFSGREASCDQPTSQPSQYPCPEHPEEAVS